MVTLIKDIVIQNGIEVTLDKDIKQIVIEHD